MCRRRWDGEKDDEGRTAIQRQENGNRFSQSLVRAERRAAALSVSQPIARFLGSLSLRVSSLSFGAAVRPCEASSMADELAACHHGKSGMLKLSPGLGQSTPWFCAGVDSSRIRLI